MSAAQMKPRTVSDSGERSHVIAPGFERVASEFQRNLAERGEVGAGFAAYLDGVPVVDLWGGFAGTESQIPWRSDTLANMFSGSKGLVATCMAMLVERGQVEPEAPVAIYWPEFSQADKATIRVQDVLSHQARLPGLTTPVTVDEATDAVHMAALLAAQRPLPRDLGGPVYHAMTFGWLCGELLRRVDGRSIGTFLREEICEPLDLELWIGLSPSEKSRVAVVERAPGSGGGGERFAARKDDELAWSIWSNPPRFAGGELAANRPSWHAAEVPATNGIGTARSMARLYGCLARGGELDGVRLLAPESIELARRRVSRGREPFLDSPISFGAGFQLQTETSEFGLPADGFGHTGAGGSVHGAWPSLGVGFSYLPNLLGCFDGVDPRAQALLDALHEAVLATRASTV